LAEWSASSAGQIGAGKLPAPSGATPIGFLKIPGLGLQRMGLPL
jgi:hypothetical protein